MLSSLSTQSHYLSDSTHLPLDITSAITLSGFLSLSLCNITWCFLGFFLSGITRSSPGCGTELRQAVASLSLPLKSRCSVAGEAAHSASTLYYVTGGNTHTHAPSLSLSNRPMNVHKRRGDDRDTFGVGALPLCILHIRMCNYSYGEGHIYRWMQLRNRSPGLKVQPGVYECYGYSWGI